MKINGGLRCDHEAEEELYVRDAVACERSRIYGGEEDGMSFCGFVSVGDFMCEWTVMMVVRGRKWGHVCIIA